MAAQIERVQPKAIETHCHGHSLNLSVKDAAKSNRLINNVLDIVVEITKLIKFSPKTAIFRSSKRKFRNRQ